MITNLSDRHWSVIGYLTLVGFVIAFFLPKDKSEFIRFHLRQSFGLWLVYLAFGRVISDMDNWEITAAYWSFFGVLFFYGIFAAIQGKSKTIPLIGPLFQKVFSSL
jgi:uncharacterized membrane protein